MAKDFNTDNDHINELLAQYRTPEFLAAGACVGQNPDWWDDEDQPQYADQAKAICAECPVRELCAAWGNKNEPTGIWGGIGTAERRKARGRKRLVTVEEHLDDVEWRQDIASRKPAAAVAIKWGRDERTVYRWRAARRAA